MEQESSFVQTLTAFLLACALHTVLVLLPTRIKNASTESSPKQESVKVTLTTPKQKVEVQPEAPTAQVNPPRAKVAPKTPPQTPTRLLTSESSAADDSEGIRVPQSTSTPAPPTQTEKPRTFSVLPEDRRSPLLPSGDSDFLERQRKLGETLGAGAIAGDLEIPDVVSEQDPNAPIRKTEYTFAGYFDSLSRRFVEAWGGVRTLPPQSRFEGKLGEFIEYDVVINRDGSLRKIVNISARKQPYRDFSAVDDLVMSVFQAMFPFQPVPDRIQNDPLVIRKRIQFVGFKYTLY